MQPLTLQSLSSIVIQGIYCLYDDSNKIIWIISSKNVLDSLTNHATMLKKGLHANKQLEADHSQYTLKYKLLEECSCQITRHIIYKQWVDKYKDLGYTVKFLKRVHPLKVKYDYQINNSKVFTHVYLESRSKMRILIGVFDNMPEAKRWITMYYSGINSFIMANNKYTKEYYGKL